MRASILACGAFLQLVSAIWPIPNHVSLGDDALWIAPDVRLIRQDHQGRPQTYTNMAVPDADDAAVLNKDDFGERIVQTAIGNMYDTIFAKSFVPWKFHPRNSNFEPAADGPKAYISSIMLDQNSSTPANISKPMDGPQVAEWEAYTLDIKDGQATITASTPLGIAHGITTFTQLFFAHTAGGSYTPYSPVSISDYPMFPHRGLNLDVSRNYYPLRDIYRTIDALAATKMNRLHVHITDAQSWPLVIPSIPELSKEGAYTPGAVYTPRALRSIQQYGALRGVQVFVETDMPGHTSSVWFSHPELIAAFDKLPDWDNYCAEPPCGTFKLNDSRVDDFVTKILSDVLPRVGEFTQYYHTGGDEVNFNSYTLDDTVGTNSSAVIRPLLQRFFDNTYDSVVRKGGMTQIVWEEMLLDYNLTLPADVVIQSWLSDESVAKIVGSGHRAIAGNYFYWYLDCGHGDWTNFEPGKAAQTNFPYLDYCAPYKNWRLMYSYDPLHGVPADKKDLVIGGEASIWAEQTDGVSIDSIIWPRLGAAAEVLWAGAKDPVTGGNRSQIEAAPRLSDFRERLVARGVRAATVQMPVCLQNGSQCFLDH